MKILASLEKKSKRYLLFVGFALIGCIGLIDLLTGYEFSFSAFYVLPVALITWFTGRSFGLLAALISAAVWFGADAASGHSYSHSFIPIWNTLIRLTLFVIITALLSALKKATAREGELARTDYLTGAVSSRFFYDVARMEIERYKRYKHPFTLAYIDLDNFKAVNDRFGHGTGDQVLRAVAASVRKCMRKTDVIARLGGDEFVLLLPETKEESARVALPKIQESLLEAMRQHDWPVTFSIGVLICNATPKSTDELVRLADELMYAVKRDSKNAIKFATYEG